MLNNRYFATLLVLALAAGAWALVPGAAQAQNAPQPTVGMVDVQKAFNDYKVTTTSNDEINKLVATLKRELDLRAANRLLSDAEIQELVKVVNKTPQTDADKQRIDELEKTSKARDEELNSLSNKTDLTEQERTRLRELKELSNKNDASGRTLAEDYSQQIDKRKSELSDKITADLKAAIAKVAQARGLATVVDKIAILYGGVDLTEDVIKELNSGK